MRLFPALLFAVVLGAISIQRADAAGQVGVRSISIAAPERADPVPVMMWYPAGSGGTPVVIGDNAVFKGTPALQSAPIAEGSFPVVLISHGGLRAAPNL